jgi:Arc/MetJ family transcription regulator
MRTNIALDDDLVRKAMALSKVSTKREAVARALEEYVRNHSRLDLRELRGKGGLPNQNRRNRHGFSIFTMREK